MARVVAAAAVLLLAALRLEFCLNACSSSPQTRASVHARAPAWRGRGNREPSRPLWSLRTLGLRGGGGKRDGTGDTADRPSGHLLPAPTFHARSDRVLGNRDSRAMLLADSIDDASKLAMAGIDEQEIDRCVRCLTGQGSSEQASIRTAYVRVSADNVQVL